MYAVCKKPASFLLRPGGRGMVHTAAATPAEAHQPQDVLVGDASLVLNRDSVSLEPQLRLSLGDTTR